MKRISILLIALLVAPAMLLMAQDTKTATTAPTEPAKLAVGAKATWDKLLLDMGNVDFQVPKTAEFTLTNEGNEPLLITYGKASCGCTGLKYSQEPVLPGKSTALSVTYNAASPGDFRKTITVQTNADANPTTLTIMGKVVKKEETPVK
jgi:hypothetical protein